MNRALLYLTIILLHPGCGDKQTEGGSDKDTNVQYDLNKDGDVVAFYNDKAGQSYMQEEVCIVRPYEFDSLILLGAKVDEHECDYLAAIYGGRLIEDRSDICRKALISAGWYSGEDRMKIVTAWVDLVMEPWSSMLGSKPADWPRGDSLAYHFPVISQSLNHITVKSWMRSTTFVADTNQYYHIFVQVDTAANITTNDRSPSYNGFVE